MSEMVFIHATLAMTVMGTGAVALLVRKKRGWHTWLGEIYHWAWLGMAISALWIGSQHPGITVFEIITPLAYLAALVGYVAAKQRRRVGPRWLYWHIQGLSISYISVITAFGVQVLPRTLLENPLFFWSWMLIPGFLAGKLVDRTLERWVPKRTTPAAPRRPLAEAQG